MVKLSVVVGSSVADSVVEEILVVEAGPSVVVTSSQVEQQAPGRRIGFSQAIGAHHSS